MYVKVFLEEHGCCAEEYEIDVAIEAAVLKLHKGVAK